MRSVVWASIFDRPAAPGTDPDAERSKADRGTTVEDGLRAAAAGDARAALRIWCEGARRGDAAAEFWVGWAHHYGQGVPADPHEAMRRYRRAAERGDARAEAAIGLLYEAGIGVPQDRGEASRRYAAAAAMGEPTAAFNLAALVAASPSKTLRSPPGDRSSR